MFSSTADCPLLVFTERRPFSAIQDKRDVSEKKKKMTRERPTLVVGNTIWLSEGKVIMLFVLLTNGSTSKDESLFHFLCSPPPHGRPATG